MKSTLYLLFIIFIIFPLDIPGAAVIQKEKFGSSNPGVEGKSGGYRVRSSESIEEKSLMKGNEKELKIKKRLSHSERKFKELPGSFWEWVLIFLGMIASAIAIGIGIDQDYLVIWGPGVLLALLLIIFFWQEVLIILGILAVLAGLYWAINASIERWGWTWTLLGLTGLGLVVLFIFFWEPIMIALGFIAWGGLAIGAFWAGFRLLFRS